MLYHNMVARRLVSGVNVLRPPWGVLGLSAGGSLLFRGAADVLWIRLTSVLDSLLAPVAVAAITLRPSPLLLVGVALEWFMLLYLLHNRLPRIIGSREEVPSVLIEERFRYLLLVVILGVGLFVATNVPSPVGPSPLHQSDIHLLAMPLPFCGLAGLVAYIWNHMAGRPPSEWLAFLENTFPWDPREDFGEEGVKQFLRDDWVGKSHRFGWVCVVVPVFLSIVCVLLGIVAGVVSLFFPVPELVVLAVAGNNLVATRWDGAPTAPIEGTAPDIEMRLYRLVRYLVLVETGMATIFFVSAVVVAMVFAYISVVALLGVARSLPLLVVTAPEAPVRVWNAVGYAACLIAPGLYGLWFWYRSLLRFPYLLTYWELRNTGTTELSPDNRLPRLVTRPRDALLAPTLVWGVAMVFGWRVDQPELLLVGTDVCDDVVCFGGGGVFDALWQYPLLDWPFRALAADTLLQVPGTEMFLFAIGWPVFLVGLPLSIWLTRRNDVQHPLTDKHVLVVAFLLQLGWLWLLITVARIPGSLVESTLGLFIPVVVGGYYLYDIEYGNLRGRVAGGVMTGGVLLLLIWSYGWESYLVLVYVGLSSMMAAMFGLRHVGTDAASSGRHLPVVLIVAGLLGMTGPMGWFWFTGRSLQLHLFVGWLSVGLLFPFLASLATTDRDINNRRTVAGGIGLGITGIAFVSLRLWDAIEFPGSHDTSLLEFFGTIRPLQVQVYIFFIMIGFLSVAILSSWVASVLYPGVEDSE